jgi:hypothetical protein
MLAVNPQVLYCCQGDSEDKHCDSHCSPQSPRIRHQKHMPFQIMQIRFSDYDTCPEIRRETIKDWAINKQIELRISLDV